MKRKTVIDDEDYFPKRPEGLKPLVITLCGSNRFEKHFKMWNKQLSLMGHAVFTTAVYPSFENGKKEWYTKEQKEIVDAVHLLKIDRSDAIFLLNVDAYIGESTLKEFEYARKRNKLVFALESWGRGNGKLMPSPIDTTTNNKIYGYWDVELFGVGASEARSNAMKALKSSIGE